MIGHSLRRAYATTKPQIGAQLSAASELRRDLVLALPFTEYGGARVINAVDGAKGTLSGTTPPVWHGNRLFFAGGSSLSSYIDFGTHPQSVDLGLGPMTIIARCTPLALLGGIAERNDGNTVGAGWEFGLNNTNALSGFTLEATLVDMRIQLTAGLLFTELAYTLGVTTDGTLTSIPKMYKNGGDRTGSGATGSGTRPSDSAQSLRIGNASFSSGSGNTIQAGSFNGWMDYIYIWRRILTPEEMVAVHVNPYALFAAPQKVFAIGVPTASIMKFRRTLAQFGTRTGTRQPHTYGP